MSAQSKHDEIYEHIVIYGFLTAKHTQKILLPPEDEPVASSTSIDP